MTTKWTKGPWLQDGLTIYTLVHHGWDKGKELFRNHWTAALSKANYGEGEITDCELESNAQLIASAPQLYTMLDKMVVLLEETGKLDKYQKRAAADSRAALSDARGENND